MIGTLINLLGSFYESKDFSKVETIARTIHKAIPGDQVSLKFLGLVYYRTGRIKDAIRLFDQIQVGQEAILEAGREPGEIEGSPIDSALTACSREATRRLPYLAQAWHELGNSLLKLRSYERPSLSFQTASLA